MLQCYLSIKFMRFFQSLKCFITCELLWGYFKEKGNEWFSLKRRITCGYRRKGNCFILGDVILDSRINLHFETNNENKKILYWRMILLELAKCQNVCIGCSDISQNEISSVTILPKTTNEREKKKKTRYYPIWSPSLHHAYVAKSSTNNWSYGLFNTQFLRA